MDYAQSYLSKQNNSLAKWHHFFEHHLGEGFSALPFADLNFAHLKHWTPDQHKAFFYYFAQFNCEALILFEQCLMMTGRLYSKDMPVPTEKQSLEYFAKEEFYHTRAFRRYLAKESVYGFPQESILVHREHRLKTYFAWVLKREPLAIIIPGAKSETYSLYFSKYLGQIFKSSENTFAVLNRMHAEDEASHIQYDYALINSMTDTMSWWRKFRFVLYTFLMILGVQFIVLFGFWTILKKVEPDTGVLRKARALFVVFRWILWDFPPYSQTRKTLKLAYRKQDRFMYRLFAIGAR